MGKGSCLVGEKGFMDLDTLKQCQSRSKVTQPVEDHSWGVGPCSRKLGRPNLMDHTLWEGGKDSHVSSHLLL